jgi:hypothetical protein
MLVLNLVVDAFQLLLLFELIIATAASNTLQLTLRPVLVVLAFQVTAASDSLKVLAFLNIQTAAAAVTGNCFRFPCLLR